MCFMCVYIYIYIYIYILLTTSTFIYIFQVHIYLGVPWKVLKIKCILIINVCGSSGHKSFAAKSCVQRANGLYLYQSKRTYDEAWWKRTGLGGKARVCDVEKVHVWRALSWLQGGCDTPPVQCVDRPHGHGVYAVFARFCRDVGVGFNSPTELKNFWGARTTNCGEPCTMGRHFVIVCFTGAQAWR